VWASSKDPGRIPQAFILASQERWNEALGKGLPDFIGSIFKAYGGYNWGVTSFAGTPLENSDGSIYKYNAWEAIVKATGFTPTSESLLWEAKGRKFEATEQTSAERTKIRRKIQGFMQRGEIDEAREAQTKAVAEGIIDESTDYVRKIGKDMFIAEALDELYKPNTRFSDVEKTLVQKLYGDKATPQQKNNVRNDLKTAEIFGVNNKYVNDLDSAQSNKEKADVLVMMKQRMDKGDFDSFFSKGRRQVVLLSGATSPILISDDLKDLYLKEVRRLRLND
jgi:hypothetical protein